MGSAGWQRGSHVGLVANKSTNQRQMQAPISCLQSFPKKKTSVHCVPHHTGSCLQDPNPHNPQCTRTRCESMPIVGLDCKPLLVTRGQCGGWSFWNTVSFEPIVPRMSDHTHLSDNISAMLGLCLVMAVVLACTHKLLQIDRVAQRMHNSA
jgi:hypothetical protein